MIGKHLGDRLPESEAGSEIFHLNCRQTGRPPAAGGMSPRGGQRTASRPSLPRQRFNSSVAGESERELRSLVPAGDGEPRRRNGSSGPPLALFRSS